MELTIYRDDYCYPIIAKSFADMRELREKENRGFISHGYGTVALVYGHPSNPNKNKGEYYDIYTEQRVSAHERRW